VSLANLAVESWRIAWLAMRSNKVRSILTTLGIVIGVTTVVLMIIIIQGLNQSFKGEISILGSNTLYVQKWPWADSDWWVIRKWPDIEEKEYRALKSHSTLAMHVVPMVETSRPVAYEERRLARVDIEGTNSEYPEISTFSPAYGRFLNEMDVARNRSVAVIGDGIKEELFPYRNPIGQRIKIGPHKFRVVGVLEKQGAIFGQSMDEIIYIPHGTLLKKFGKHRDWTIVMAVKDVSQMDDLEIEARGILRKVRRLSPGDRDNFSLNKQSQIMDFYNKITAGVYGGGVIIAFISLLVGGIGIMNIMLVSVTERTHEIGIRKAIGAKRSHILWQFLTESAFICAVGGAIGILLAFLLGLIIDKFLPTAMPVWVIFLALGFSAMVGLFFGIWPASKAARMNPIEALRYE
jgi:putative ABC transport system permease protein